MRSNKWNPRILIRVNITDRWVWNWSRDLRGEYFGESRDKYLQEQTEVEEKGENVTPGPATNNQ